MGTLIRGHIDDNETGTMLCSSSRTRIAHPTIFGDDFLRIELEEIGEVVPILFLSISVVFSLALDFALCLSLSFFRLVCLYIHWCRSSLFITLLYSCAIMYLPTILSLFISIFFCLSTSSSTAITGSNVIVFVNGHPRKIEDWQNDLTKRRKVRKRNRWINR